MSDRENNRIQIFDTNGKLLKTWNHLGSTQGIWISPKDEMYILTHRNNVENITADTLAGRLMKIDLESGKVLGSMESPGHSVNGSPNGDIFVGEPDGKCAAVDAAPGIYALALTSGVNSGGDRGRGRWQISLAFLPSTLSANLPNLRRQRQNPGVSENPQIHPRPGRSNGRA